MGRQIHRRMPQEGKGREWGSGSLQAKDPQRLWQITRSMEAFPYRRAWPCEQDTGLTASRTVRHISVILSHLVCNTLLLPPQETNTGTDTPLCHGLACIHHSKCEEPSLMFIYYLPNTRHSITIRPPHRHFSFFIFKPLIHKRRDCSTIYCKEHELESHVNLNPSSTTG